MSQKMYVGNLSFQTTETDLSDLFAQAVLHDTPVPTPLDDAVANMRVIEALVESAKQGRWVDL